MATKQTPEELEGHLNEQIVFLKVSAEAYDKGFSGEAKRLAIALRILLHDTSSSRSLLGQLGRKNGMFLDSSFPLPSNDSPIIASYAGLAVLGSKAMPKLEDRECETMKPFEEWWHRVVIIDNERNSFTRESIVLNVADKDGGAHIDPSLNDAYMKLTRKNSMGWKYRKCHGKIEEATLTKKD
ncbi:MAG: hypothetical protein AAB588_06875 [Patescibacteria group bacterium]